MSSFPAPEPDDALTFDEAEAAAVDGTLRFDELTFEQCSDCGNVAPIHPDSYDQRGEPICHRCVELGAFDPS